MLAGMREKAITLLLLVLALIHLIPLTGFVGSSELESLYGIAIDSAELEILLRHRAVLFGILGGIFILAAFVAHYRALAFAIAATSILPFFYLLREQEAYNEAIYRIALGDTVALLSLLLAVGLSYGSKLSRNKKARL